MGSTRSVVQAVGNDVELRLTMHGKVGAFGQILAQQAIGIFTSSALPRAMWIAKIDVHASLSGKFLMS